MKNIILTLLGSGILSVCQAQVPDSAGRMKSSRAYGTDSVKHGNVVYNGTKSKKNQSNGDTLSSPQRSKKSGTKSPQTNTK